MSELQAINSVFNIEIEKIDPNPDQPRKHFSQESLRDLSESIRRYGVMQPITVVRRENETAEGITTRYEIIAGERRWRASVLAGMATIPAIIRESEESEQERFELSILENLQREDLNPVDKARSFARLANEFSMKHAEIADKLGKSREYVTNALRLLVLPENVLDALSNGEISEGHTRPLLSLKDKADEMQVLFNEIKIKSLTVREAEKLARELSGKRPKTSKYANPAQAVLDPEMEDIKTQLAQTLGTPVSIDKKEQGGKLTIEFFSRDDLKKLLAMMDSSDMADVIAQQNSQNTDYVSKPAATQTPVAGEAPVYTDNLDDGAGQQTVTVTNQADFVPNTAQVDLNQETSMRAHTQLASEDDISPVGSSVGIQPAIENSIADFVGIDSSLGTNTQKNTLPDDFDITPRYQSAISEKVLQDKPVIEQSAHRSEPVRNVSNVELGSIETQNMRAQELQKEINQLAGVVQDAQAPATSFSDTVLGPKKIDLGELDLHESEYAPKKNPSSEQDDISVSRDVESTTPGHEMHIIDGGGGGFSAPVAAVGSEFVPAEPSVSQSVDVSVNGDDFTSSASVDLQNNKEPDYSDVAMNMGGQNFTDAAPQGPITGDNQPKAAPINASEKYPQGDPYRLDNFSI